jgi:hypothetical protein
MYLVFIVRRLARGDDINRILFNAPSKHKDALFMAIMFYRFGNIERLKQRATEMDIDPRDWVWRTPMFDRVEREMIRLCPHQPGTVPYDPSLYRELFVGEHALQLLDDLPDVPLVEPTNGASSA